MRRVIDELDWEHALEPSFLRITRMRLEVMDCLVHAVAGAGHDVHEAQQILAQMWDIYAEMIDAARALQIKAAIEPQPCRH